MVERTEVKVLVRVNVEQKCFQFDFEISQTWLQQLSAFFTNDPVTTAKEIAEWIGIIGKVGGVIGLIGFIKWLCKQRSTINELSVTEDGSNVIIRNETNNQNITINNNVFILTQNRDLLKNMKYVIQPLTKSGYDVLQFEHNSEVVEEISSDEGKQINGLNVDNLEFRPRVNTAVSETRLKVKKAVFEGHSMWEFILDKSIEAKIEDTLWLDRYQGRTCPGYTGKFS